MITQWYDPEGGSARQAGIIARRLKALGMDVRVLTGFPNYPQGTLYPGYRIRPVQHEVLDGIAVTRVPLYPSHEATAISRVLNYLSYAASASVGALFSLRDADVVLVHGTPVTPGIPAMVLRRVFGVPFVFHVQDLWPDTVTASGFLTGRRAARIERVLHGLCDRIYRSAARVAVTAPGMRDRIMARGIPAEKIALVTNWADERVFAPQPGDPRLRAEFGLTRPFTVMYAGNFGAVQGLETLIRAAEVLRERTDIGFALVGAGVDEPKLRELVAQLDLDNVTFVPPQDMNRMGEVLALGDLAYVGLNDLPIFRITLPSKLQMTMAAGRPIIGAVSGDAAAVINESGAGRTVPIGDPQAIADAVEYFHGHPEELAVAAAKSRQYYQSTFSEQAASGVLATLLAQAARERVR